MTDKTERLVNLVIALKEVRRPVSFAWIKDAIHAYDQADPESARRQFERDKDTIREMGIPIETRDVDALSGEVGYIIDEKAYALPPVELSGAEIAALAVALQMTGEERARLAYAKLAARAPDPEQGDEGSHARVSLGLTAVEHLAPAVKERRAVAFGYRNARGETSDRVVDPYVVPSRRGHMYLVGRDHGPDEVRAFRLDRFTTEPKPVGEAGAFEVPGDLDFRAHIEGPERDRKDLRLALSPRVAWEARSRGGEVVRADEHDRIIVEIAQAPVTRTVSWILGLGPDAEVLEPSDIRDRVAQHLRALAEVDA